MPGMDSLAPERQETSSGFFGSPKPLPVVFSIAFSAASSCSHIPSGNLLARGQVGVAGLGGDGEAGRDRQLDARHLEQIRALAAEQAANGIPTAADVLFGVFDLGEQVDPLLRHGSRFSLRLRQLHTASFQLLSTGMLCQKVGDEGMKVALIRPKELTLQTAIFNYR